jgi:hypothetical protein
MDRVKGGISVSYPLSSYLILEPCKSWKDLGVTSSTTSKSTAGMLAALQAYHGGTRFSAEDVSTTGSETSELDPILCRNFWKKSRRPKAPGEKKHAACRIQSTAHRCSVILSNHLGS